MANQTRKRRRKHRGTQTGRIDNRRRARPRNRQEARARARNQRGQRGGHRHDQPPTWGGASVRGAFASLAFFLIVWLLFKRTVPQAAALAIFMLAFYVPLGYYTDRFFYRRRQRQKEAERQAAKAARGGTNAG